VEKPIQTMIMTSELLFTTLNALLLVNNEIPDPYSGICSNVNDALEMRDHYLMTTQSKNLLQHLWEDWPLNAQLGHAGMYPIKGYNVDKLTQTVWQNPNRQKLLRWLICKLAIQICPELATGRHVIPSLNPHSPVKWQSVGDDLSVDLQVELAWAATHKNDDLQWSQRGAHHG